MSVASNETVASESRPENPARLHRVIRRIGDTRSPRALVTALLGVLAVWAGCSDLRENLAPSEESGHLSYVADIKPILDGGCITCHNSATPIANYDLSQYDTGAFGGVLGSGSDAVPNVIPGDESSLVIQRVDVQGSMRQYLSGGAGDAEKIRRWVVADSARKE